MMYGAQPTITKTQGEWTGTRQIPTFFLDSRVQGIVNMQHAEHIVREICNPTNDPTITVNPNITPIQGYRG